MKAQEQAMQEVLPFVMGGRPYQYPDLKIIVSGMKWLLAGTWKLIRWLLEAMFTPPPGQKYIEESRNRAMRLIGHF